MADWFTTMQLSEATGVSRSNIFRLLRRNGVKTTKAYRNTDGGVREVTLIPASFAVPFLNRYKEAAAAESREAGR